MRRIVSVAMEPSSLVLLSRRTPPPARARPLTSPRAATPPRAGEVKEGGPAAGRGDKGELYGPLRANASNAPPPAALTAAPPRLTLIEPFGSVCTSGGGPGLQNQWGV